MKCRKPHNFFICNKVELVKHGIVLGKVLVMVNLLLSTKPHTVHYMNNPTVTCSYRHQLSQKNTSSAKIKKTFTKQVKRLTDVKMLLSLKSTSSFKSQFVNELGFLVFIFKSHSHNTEDTSLKGNDNDNSSYSASSSHLKCSGKTLQLTHLPVYDESNPLLTSAFPASEKRKNGNNLGDNNSHLKQWEL